jgi:hypothetical protein
MSQTAKLPRIFLAALKTRAEKADLSEAEIRAYFAEDKDRSEPFKPAVKIDTDMVDTGGQRKPTARQTAELYQKATRTPKKAVEGVVPVTQPKVLATRATAMAKSTAAVGKRVLGEGDSWFNLPAFIYPPTALDILAQTLDVHSIAMWSDTLENMVSTKQYRQPLGSGAFRHFLFSGGGNDVLGSIDRYVSRRKPGDTNPANAPGYVNGDFPKKLAAMMKLYASIASDVKVATKGATILYVHGYANAVPKKNGPYIGRRLEALNFDPASALAQAVVRHMVAMFNAVLKTFAAQQANVVYLDLRPAMTASDWIADEIHPRKSGSEKIARLFRDAIAKNT